MADFLNEDDALKDFYRILKASSVAQEADKEKDEEKQDKLFKRERRLKQKLQREELEDLFELFDKEMLTRMEKPQLQDSDPSAHMGTPQDFNAPPSQGMQHPVIQQRQMVDNLRSQGMGHIDAHQQVHGETDLGNIESKGKMAATMGRVQKDGTEHGIQYERGGEFKSVLTTDADIEVKLDQVSRDDLRTKQSQQVPDNLQTPAMQVAEELDTEEEIDYTEFDVAYLQQFGRA